MRIETNRLRKRVLNPLNIAHKDCSFPQLWHSQRRAIQDTNVRLISDSFEVFDHLLLYAPSFKRDHPRNVFHHEELGFDRLYNLNEMLVELVSIVINET